MDDMNRTERSASLEKSSKWQRHLVNVDKPTLLASCDAPSGNPSYRLTNQRLLRPSIYSSDAHRPIGNDRPTGCSR